MRCQTLSILIVSICLTPSASFGNQRAGDGAASTWPVELSMESLSDGGVALVDPPGNDECVNAEPISGTGLFPFDNTGATGSYCIYDDERYNAYDTVWYLWTSPCDGTVIVDTCGGTMVDTGLAVFAGSDCTGLTDRFLAGDNASCGGQSRTSFTAQTGEEYLIVLGTEYSAHFPGAYASSPGPGNFAITCADLPADPSSGSKQEICQQSDQWEGFTSDRIESRTADDFSPTEDGEIERVRWWGSYSGGDGDCFAAGSDAFEISYYTDAGGVPGEVFAGPFSQIDGSLSVRGPARVALAGGDGLVEVEYTADHEPVLVLAGECYWIEISNAQLNDCAWQWRAGHGGNLHAVCDGPPTGAMDGYDSADRLAVDFAFGLDVLRWQACGSRPAPVNDACENALPVTDGVTYFDTATATTDGPVEPDFFPLGDHQLHRDVWFNYRASCSSTLTVSVCGSEFDTKLAVYDSSTCPPSEAAIASSDEFCGDVLPVQSQVSLPTTQGTFYKIRVGGFGTQRGSDCFVAHDSAGCSDTICQSVVCEDAPGCCTPGWDDSCIDLAVERCLGDIGPGMLTISCGDLSVESDCAEAEAEDLPATFTGNSANAARQCELVPGSHTWVSFRVASRSMVTVDYAGTNPPMLEAADLVTRGCPCRESEQAALVSVDGDGNRAFVWDCLPAGVYYYPVLSGPGSEGDYVISVTAEPCVDVCADATGDCCVGHDSPGCADSECCADLCAYDPYCCTDTWDDLCAREAIEVCVTCPSEVCVDAVGGCYEAHDSPGCRDPEVCQAVCACDPYCCEWEWDEFCAGSGLSPGCGADNDCNHNTVTDVADIMFGGIEDRDGNHIPDECESDCNANGIVDECDILDGTSEDCNLNRIPDECDPDCNFNLIPDDLDILSGYSNDCNENTVPDECEPGADCNGNGILDFCDLAAGTSEDQNLNGIPDDCELNHTFYIDDDAPGDPGPGDPEVSDPAENGTPEHPFDAIQKALNIAISGDVILVEDGTYTGSGNRDIDFRGTSAVLRSRNGAANCVIDCESLGRAFFFHNEETHASVVDGFTIENGEAPVGDGNGGAVLCSGNSSPTITRCIFRANHAAEDGGAVSLHASGPVITSCVFAGNVADISGGAVHVSNKVMPGISCTIRGCTMTGNRADSGGAIFVSASYSYRDLHVDLYDTIVWDDGIDAPIHVSGSGVSMAVSYSDIRSGRQGVQGDAAVFVWGPGNTGADPLLADPARGDYHLQPGSPCIDGGDPTFSPEGDATDVYGGARLHYCRVDIGADESVYFVDCDEDSLPDSCEMLDPTEPDCNKNFILDNCEPDCDENGVPDTCDLAANPSLDCNGNDTLDDCDISSGFSTDCQPNGVPDECDLGFADVIFADDFPTLYPDSALWPVFTARTSSSLTRSAPYSIFFRQQQQMESRRLNLFTGQRVVANYFWRTHYYTSEDGFLFEFWDGNEWQTACRHPNINNIGWYEETIELPDNALHADAEIRFRAVGGYSMVTYLDDVTVTSVISAISTDCNDNGTPDECEHDNDCNSNGIPDDCEHDNDCNSNGIPDECEHDNDCNSNSVPDECELQFTRSLLVDSFPNVDLDYDNWPIVWGAGTTDAQSQSLPYSLELAGTDEIESRSVNLATAESAELVYFWQNSATQSGDDLILEYWDGAVWMPWVEHPGYPLVGEWQEEAMILPEGALHSEFKLRFRALASSDDHYWFIDDVDLIAAFNKDCNDNGLPDECEAGDWTGDGLMDLDDCAGLFGCLTGAGEGTSLDAPAYHNACCVTGDIDADGDVDLGDLALLQNGFNTPRQ